MNWYPVVLETPSGSMFLKHLLFSSNRLCLIWSLQDHVSVLDVSTRVVQIGSTILPVVKVGSQTATIVTFNVMKCLGTKVIHGCRILGHQRRDNSTLTVTCKSYQRHCRLYFSKVLKAFWRYCKVVLGMKYLNNNRHRTNVFRKFSLVCILMEQNTVHDLHILDPIILKPIWRRNFSGSGSIYWVWKRFYL